MALGCVGGIILGQVAGELKGLIKNTTVEVIYFGKFRERLQSKLEFLTHLLEEVDRLNEQITDRPTTHIQKLKDELLKGKELVIRCSNVSTWNGFSRSRYSKKILKLEKTLREFFPMIVTGDIWFICQKTLLESRERESRMMSSGSGSEVACAAPVPDTVVFGLDFPLKELKKPLFKLEGGPRVIGICAPGGSGKTTLAVKLCRDEEVKGSFKNIFFLTVSSSPNLKEMVKRLFQQLKNQLPTFQNDEDAVTQLGNLLKREEPNNTLLVLDDVWHESVINKFVFIVKGYKILVTSRTNHPIFDYTYPLRMLREPHDMALFRYWAFPQYGEGNHQEPTMVLQKIVSGCKGHPLALRLIGCSLRQQPVIVWQNKEELLSSCSILESHDDLLKCLGSSLNCLKKNVHECFLDLGAFPKDQRIPASSLIDIWVELYGIDEFEAFCNLLELSTRTLVNMSEFARGEAGDVNMNKLFVAQHDLLRELAICQSRQQGTRLIMERREDNLLSIRRQQDQLRNTRLISIQTGEEFSSNWLDMHFPKAEVLILDCFAKQYTLPPFMKKMKKLKVLIIVNHGHYHTKLSHSTKVGYLSRLKRVRLEKVSVSSLSEIKKPLKNLQKISLFMCEVAQALGSCNFNFPFMLPNLVEIDIDYCSLLEELPQGICDLVHVKNLSITNCHELSTLPEKIGCMRDLEVLRLHACTKLSKLPDSLRKLQKLSLLDISDCLLMELPEWIGELGNLRTLNMKGCSEPRELPRSTMKLVHLQNLICDEGAKYSWESLNLSELNITVSKDTNLDWLGN